jgi:RecA-family ATPase
MATNSCVNAPGGTFILNAEEWLKADFGVEESHVLIGTPDNPIIRPLTKNLVEASDKSFKTTFLLRLTLAMATGTSVYPSLPVLRPRKILYLHGELAPPELKERLRDAARDLPRPLENFFQGRSLNASLVTPGGQEVLRQVVEIYDPEVLVIDPWQSFIAGQMRTASRMYRVRPLSWTNSWQTVG